MAEKERFLSLFLTNQSDLFAFIASLIRDPHVREDVFQETALALWRDWEKYDPNRSFGAWARGVAAHRILQQRDRRLPFTFSPEAIATVLESYDRTERDNVLVEDALRQCLGDLPDESRRLLALRYEKSMKLREIAETAQSTLAAVHKSLSRLRLRLADCIERRMQAANASS